MPYDIPSTQQVQNLLQGLKHAELIELDKQSGVPLSTLLKIRHNVTNNPGLDTVRKVIDAPLVAEKLATQKATHLASLPRTEG